MNMVMQISLLIYTPDMWPRVVWQNHKIGIVLVFKETSILISIVCNLTNSVWDFLFPQAVLFIPLFLSFHFLSFNLVWKKSSFTIYCSDGLLEMNHTNLFLSISLSYLHSDECFHRVYKLSWYFFCFSLLKDVVPLLSSSPSFHMHHLLLIWWLV
jgi:hypothetical protein